MFLVLDNETGEHDFSLKPMNCPSHYLMYQAKKHSYRELPLRYVTFDVLHRNEVTGALSGLTRVRQFQQDDCHVFLREDQIKDEVAFLLRFILGYYAKRSASRRGSSLRRVRRSASVPTRCGIARNRRCRPRSRPPGTSTSSSRATARSTAPRSTSTCSIRSDAPWQLGTIQLDYSNPERFDLTYVGEDNAPHRPVIIHRAVSGSLERFIAILIEHYAGAFPVWLAPEQVRVLPISQDMDAAAKDITARLRAAGVRAHCDDRNETLNYRIREGEVMKVPYMAVVGKREVEQGTLAIRSRGAGTKQDIVPIADFIERVTGEIKARA